MKYLSLELVRWAIGQLRKKAHPFVGISFLACKEAELPVGRTVSFGLDAHTKAILEKHHRLDPDGKSYFQPFKSTKSKFWIANKYPSAGLQAINTRFGSVFVRKGQRDRGFHSGYIQLISDRVASSPGYGKTPLHAVAVWFGKDKAWPDACSIPTVVGDFLSRFRITDAERRALFDTDEFPAHHHEPFVSEQPDLRVVAHDFGLPPDAPVSTEGTLTAVHLRDIGPAKTFDLDFGERLTLIAGDNGLGKTFLLDTTWWAMTGEWVDRQAVPVARQYGRNPSVQFEIRSTDGRRLAGSSTFDWNTHSWTDDGNDRPSVAALCIYARIDGSIAVADELRGQLQLAGRASRECFSTTEAWNGRQGEIEGLVRDWVTWQSSREQEAFATLTRVLEHLSAADLGSLAPGEPVRMPGDPREIPTVTFPYGEVPIVLTSAGVRRILVLAYMIIWSWREHIVAAQQVGREPVDAMVILVDEMEGHLHPRWQRVILPALMTLGGLLGKQIKIQVVVATHSPMVLASVEPDFSEETDALYHLALDRGDVTMRRLKFQKYGDSSGWLTSPVFGLRHARSREAEDAIEAAKKLQLQNNPQVAEVERVNAALRRCLSPDDPFWPRWVYFADQAGSGS